MIRTSPADVPHEKIVNYRGIKELFDDAYDLMQAYVAACRDEHPEATIRSARTEKLDDRGYLAEVSAREARP